MNIDVHSNIDKEDRPLTRADVESLLQEVGSSDKLNLSGRNLSQINLTGFDLKGAHLEGARLEGANLEGADLAGAHLERAHLERAHLERAILTGAYLKGAYLEGENLKGVRLERAILTGAYLKGAILIQANLEGANLERAILTGAYLKRAYIAGANLEGARLEDVNLEGADLAGANLKRAHLERAILAGAHLEGARLWRADLAGAYFKGAYLEGAILIQANLAGANLAGANLAGANLAGANLKRAYITGAYFKGAYLEGAIGLSPDELQEITAENTEKTPETTIKQTGGNAAIQIRINEEPLTAQNLISTLKNFITLYTTYWLIQQERFNDALQYANHGGKHFEEEAHLIIGELKYNSPADIKFNIDLSPESFVNALKTLIDTIFQIKDRKKALELANQAQELNNRNKEVELNKKAQDYAIREIEKLIDLSAKIDPATSIALKQRLAEQLLQLCSNPKVHITLLAPNTHIEQEQKADNALNHHITHASEQSSIEEPSPSLPEENSLSAESIATAIIAAISAKTIAGLTDTAKTAITDSYNKLKELLMKKYGKDSEVVQAIEKLEAKPDSKARKEMLAEEITAVRAEQGEEILAVAKQILILVKSQQASMDKSNIQNNGYVQGQNIGDYQHITQHFGDLPKAQR